MLNDRTRTQRYFEALRESVRPDSVVVDVGTGSGVLALAAAKAGARHVYAFEIGRMADAAEALFAGNGMADRITLLRGDAFELELPEAADILVSETIGREPLEQYALELSIDARERLLKPDGILIPHAMAIHATPVEIPADELDRIHFTEATTARLRQWYDIDFTPLATAPVPRVMFKPGRTVLGWPRLAAPVEVAFVDFARATERFVEQSGTAKVDRPGTVNGILVSFDLRLSPGSTFTTHPDRVSPDNSWKYTVILPEPVSVEPGAELDLTYRYRVPGRQPGVDLTIR
ncbi:class I SAM-dependent methyltransferase [Microbispora sp. NPDC088329]|uniref:class I SAM-dependent methyltransferase n=1 Tax=unclassified Microbispora TaxID=2614687 RepID=UPI0034194C96